MIIFNDRILVCDETNGPRFEPRMTNFRYVPFYPLARLLYLAATNGGLGFRNAHIFVAFVFRYILFEPLRLLELLLFERKILKHQVTEPPIFVLGHWRSGTTQLQHLLASDENHAPTSLYQFLFIDHFILSESWLKGKRQGEGPI